MSVSVLDPETDIMDQFLDPKTDIMGERTFMGGGGISSDEKLFLERLIRMFMMPSSENLLYPKKSCSFCFK